ARFAGQDYLGMLAELGGPGSPRLPNLARVVVVDGERHGPLTAFDSLRDLGAAVGDAELDAAQRAVKADDVAYILYTSGTTSTPKGVQLAHGGLIENMWNIGERQHLTPADRMWMGISLFWSFGCANALLTVMTRGGRGICNDYGLTETYGSCSVTDAHDSPDVRRSTVGFPLPGMEIRIVDRQTRRPLPTGEVGEILVRGYLTPGYYKDPDKN